MINLVLRIAALLVTAGTLVALFAPIGAGLGAPASALNPTIPVSVAAAPLNLVCPGALLRLGGTDGTDPDLRERIAEARVSVGSADQAPTSLGGDPLALVGGFVEARISASGVLANQTATADQGSPLLTAAQSQSVQVARMQGLASSACIQPAAESWFIAGSTEPGSETILILVNPSQVTSTVTVAAHAASGGVSSDQVVIPAGETRLFQLDSILNSESEFSLHISASQGKVAAFLQQRETNGLSASGIDLVTPAAAAALFNVVPGILVRGSNLRVAGEVGNWLRVYNPGTEAAELLIEVVGSTTEQYGGVLQATVSAKNTVDIPLVGLPDGTYAAFVTSTMPVMAGAFSEGAVSLEAKDIAWSQGAVSQPASFAFAVPTGGQMQITNPAEQSVTLSISDSQGTTAIVLPAKSTRLYPAASGLLRVDASATGLVANLVLDAELGFGVVALGLNQNFGSEVLVEVDR